MKPKNIAIMLLGKKKAEDEGDEGGGEEPQMPPLEDIMREFIDAVKADDPKAAAKAFRGAQACSDGDDYGGDEETDDTKDEE